ncbi:helix-turn-helix domain-containing protein [Thalassotalea crassostreae]|uniref:helix-turn-helix domain-containing protein n=1 Tax=Thalassotalea crassostreae TaxID=1763536 RepID=UPI0008391253|nr:AraC family transcriptional regulator [Thalassotalea crassostreae]
MLNNRKHYLQVVAFDQVLAKHCRDELLPYCELENVYDMAELECSASNAEAIIYVMDYTCATHLHNIEFIREKFPQSLLFVAATAVSIPLLHSAIHLGVNDVFLFPFSEEDKVSFICKIQKGTSIKCHSDELEAHHQACCSEVTRDNPMSTLLDIIEKDYAKGPSLQDLSHDIHLSPSRLCHMFKDICGITYSHYLICRKLEEGERLLSENKNSITTIAYQLGFSNPSHFSRSFKEHFNLTPNAYAQGGRDVTQSATYIRYQRLRSELLPNLAHHHIANSMRNKVASSA